MNLTPNSSPPVTTTNFDLNKTAAAAALSALAADALGVESIKLEAFTAAGHDRIDFGQWQILFNLNTGNFQNLQKQPAPSAVAAAKSQSTPATTGSTSTPSPNVSAANANKTQAAAATSPA